MAARNKLYRKAMNLLAEHLDGEDDSGARVIVHKLLKDRSLKVIECNNTNEKTNLKYHRAPSDMQ